jgi:hypothetical protein
MPKQPNEQLDVAAFETGISELLRAHDAISDAWFSNWRAEQRARLERLLLSRTSQDQAQAS